MRLSVVMPTYNAGRYLGEVLQSICLQTRKADELIVSDDGSVDGTCSLVEAFAEHAPFEVRLLHHRPSGITANYLNGLSGATGDVILFADHDDCWVPSRVAAFAAAFERNPRVALVSADSRLVDETGHDLGRSLRGGARRSRQLASEVHAGNDLAVFLKGALPLLAHTLGIRSVCRRPVLEKPEGMGAWWFEHWVSSIALSLGHLALLPEALTLYRQHARQAAGAPSGGHLLSREESQAFHRDRLQQLRYCLGIVTTDRYPALLGPEGIRYRMETLTQCISFWERRNALQGKPVLKRMLSSSRLYAAGGYSRFASGWLSCARDMLAR